MTIFEEPEAQGGNKFLVITILYNNIVSVCLFTQAYKIMTNVLDEVSHTVGQWPVAHMSIIEIIVTAQPGHSSSSL